MEWIHSSHRCLIELLQVSPASHKHKCNIPQQPFIAALGATGMELRCFKQCSRAGSLMTLLVKRTLTLLASLVTKSTEQASLGVSAACCMLCRAVRRNQKMAHLMTLLVKRTLTMRASLVISHSTENARRSTPARRLQMSSVSGLGSMSIRRCTR